MVAQYQQAWRRIATPAPSFFPSGFGGCGCIDPPEVFAAAKTYSASVVRRGGPLALREARSNSRRNQSSATVIARSFTMVRAAA